MYKIQIKGVVNVQGVKGAGGVPDLRMVEIEFNVVFDRGGP